MKLKLSVCSDVRRSRCHSRRSLLGLAPLSAKPGSLPRILPGPGSSGQPAEDGAVPPFDGDVGKVQRSILHDKPRITRFPIDWQPLQPGHSENVPASTSAPSVGGGMEAGMMEVDGNSVDGLPQAQAAMQPPPSFGSGAAALEASYEAAGAAAIAAAPPMAPMGAMAMSMS